MALFIPHREPHEPKESEGGQLQPEVVPWGCAQVVQQTSFHRAVLGEAVVGVQQVVDGDDAEQVEVGKEHGAPCVLEACAPAQHQGDEQRGECQHAVRPEECDEADVREIGLQGGGDEGLDAGGQHAEVDHGACPAFPPPQGDECHRCHGGAEVQRQVLNPFFIRHGTGVPDVFCNESSGQQ